MPRFKIPTHAHIQAAYSFLSKNNPFVKGRGKTVLELHPRWLQLDPFSLAVIGAWGNWCQQHGQNIEVKNIGKHANYAARMRLFEYLGIEYSPPISEHEEAGRFMPLTQVKDQQQLTSVIANISALLHLEQDPDSLAAVQYCISELLRNVLEHSGASGGAFVCAQRYTTRSLHRVTIGVADCGQGVAKHLGHVYPDALHSDNIALGLAMRPGITGALPGLYGTPNNAGAGLFITRCIAKGTGGYFLMISGDAGYRLRRAKSSDDQIALYIDPFDEPRHDLWQFPSKWLGTTVALEICTEKIADFQDFFQWVRKRIPERVPSARKIRFT
jgi:hypothetical protein